MSKTPTTALAVCAATGCVLAVERDPSSPAADVDEIAVEGITRTGASVHADVLSATTKPPPSLSKKKKKKKLFLRGVCLS